MSEEFEELWRKLSFRRRRGTKELSLEVVVPKL